MRSAPTSPGSLTSYKILRVLKNGSTSQTLLALDRRADVQVVIKAVELAALSSDARRKLRHEGALLKDLGGSNVATVIDTFQEGARLYVVTPFVEGITLRRRIESGRLGVAEALIVARDVLRSLAEMHDRGVLHRDVRPANVMINEHGPVSSATLVGVGLTPRPSLAPPESDSVTGIPRYLSPELAGALGRPVDCRSDLYSAGIVLFECLAARPPFDGKDLREILRQQLSGEPPRLRSLGVPVPQALEEILHRLMHSDPDDRYQSARAALADVDELATALRKGIHEPGVAVGSHDWRETLTEPPLTGRERELALLARRLEDARAGAGETVIVQACSGGGKSRVLEEFCERASALDARILRGRGTERSARQPLQMLAGVVEDLVKQAQAEPAFAAELARRLAEQAGPLCDALPELHAVLGEVAPSGHLSESQARGRLLTALVSLLEALGSEHRTAVVVLDDCQWADELTLAVLEAWAQGRGAASDQPEPRHVLVVAAMRSEETGPHQRLAELEGVDGLTLPALDAAQVGQVVESMAGQVPAEATKVVVELSRGNPLMISAVLRGLVEVAALTPNEEGWRFTPVAGGWQASRESAALLASRFALLATPTRRLLNAGAVLGREFDLEMAASLAGQQPGEAGEAVRQAVDRHLVWASSSDAGTGRLVFAHDRLRTSLLAELDPAELAALHRRAGDSLEAHAPGRDFDIAYHFDAAGESERALPYALRSAAQARARHDIELAERQYRIAERGMQVALPTTRYTLLEALGEILMLRGRYEEAAERFASAREVAVDKMQIAWIEGQLGELQFRYDNLGAAAAHIEAGLRVLGERIRTGAQGKLLLWLLWELARRIVRHALGRESSRPPNSDPDTDRLTSHLYTRLQYPRWFHARRVEGLWMMLRQVNVAERCPGSAELAHAYSVWGGALALTFPFMWRRGLRYVTRASLIYRELGDPRGEGHAASMRTCVLHGAGRYQEAVESADEAITILSQFGDRWEVGFAARNRAVCLYRLGRLREAREEARRVHGIGVAVGDANAQVTALDVMARVTGGQIPAELAKAAVEHGGDDIEVSVAALHADALRLRRDGRQDEAIAQLERAVRLVGKAQPTSTHLVPVFAWLATLHREAAERPLLPAERRRLLRRARASARRAVRYGRMYPNDLPHALRELGVVNALAGQRRRALWRLNEAAERAHRREAWSELAETRSQRERLGFAPGLRSGEPETFEPALSAEWAGQLSLGLAERFSALLEAGALLASCDSAGATAAAIRQTCQTLLRAERCRVVGLERDWRLDDGSVAPEEAEAVRAAVRECRPVILSGAAEDGPADGLTLAGARSALCAPVFVGAEMTGYFLATHSRVGRLFGDEERRLAEFVARLAGAALERQRLHRESRARVISAQEAERSRVARDLHDEIGQALTSVLLDVRSVEGAVANHPARSDEVLARVAELRRDVAGALDSVQRLAFDLRPAVLDDLGLLAALRRLTTSTIISGVDVELETVDLAAEDRLPTDIETTAYRVVQEGITNVARHSRARSCSVIIGRVAGRLRIVMEDDGVGFDPDGPSAGGLGLLGMKERAALVGGTLAVKSGPGLGTSIVFEVHLDD